MNRSTLRRFSAASLIALVGGLVLGPLAAIPAAAAAPTVIDVLTFNDFHGRIEAGTPSATAPYSAGAAVLSGLAKQMRAANPNTIVASAGDNVGASTFTSFVANDQPTIDALNAVGVDVSTLGNHEFDQGRTDVDTRLVPKFAFPLISANIIDKNTGPYAYNPHFIKTLDGVRVAFVGAITQDMPGLVSPTGITTLQFDDIATGVNKVATDLRDGNAANGEADVVILLVHEGSSDASDASVLGNTAFGNIVTKTADHVDAIVSGHTHQAYNKSFTTASGKVVPVIESAKYGEMYGHLTITADSATHQLVSIASEVKNLPGAAAADPAVQAIVDSAVTNSAALGAKSLGSITADLRRALQSDGKTENRGGESTMSNLLADVNLWATSSLGSQVALQNPGGVRADILYASGGAADPEGNVTYKEAATVQPFANTLVTLDLTGAQLKQVLEEQWQPAGLSRPMLKLGVSKGFQYTYDPGAAAGSHINGTSFATGETVTVKVSSMLFSNAGAKAGDATLSLGGTVVATAPLTFTIKDAYDEQGEATLSFVVPKGLYGAQVATLAGPGGTSIAVGTGSAPAPAPCGRRRAPRGRRGGRRFPWPRRRGRSRLLRGGDLVDGGQAVERARVADVRDELAQRVEQHLAAVADTYVAGDMALRLGVAATLRHDEDERQQLAQRQVDPATRVVVAEAVRGEPVLDVLRVRGGRVVQLLHPVPDDGHLRGPAVVEARLGRRRGLTRKGQLDVTVGEHVVGDREEVVHAPDAQVEARVVDDLLHLDGRHPVVEGGTEQDPVLGVRLAPDEAGEDDEQLGPGIERAVFVHLAEREVAEVLDELGVGLREPRAAVAEEPVVVELRGGVESHGVSSCQNERGMCGA